MAGEQLAAVVDAFLRGEPARQRGRSPTGCSTPAAGGSSRKRARRARPRRRGRRGQLAGACRPRQRRDALDLLRARRHDPGAQPGARRARARRHDRPRGDVGLMLLRVLALSCLAGNRIRLRAAGPLHPARMPILRVLPRRRLATGAATVALFALSASPAAAAAHRPGPHPHPTPPRHGAGPSHETSATVPVTTLRGDAVVITTAGAWGPALSGALSVEVRSAPARSVERRPYGRHRRAAG